MYKGIITYKLAKGISQRKLLAVAKRVADQWMKKQKGFVKWEIHTQSDGSYTDIVYWKSEKDAKASFETMKDIPNAAEWYACYKDKSIVSKGIAKVAGYQGGDS